MTVDQRQWAREAIRIIEADFQRSADTHLIPLETPGLPGVELYFKDESSHPTGSLKHRLARSLFLYALCNGWLRPAAPVIEASSGSTAISEAYFARLLGLPFIAVMPASTSKEKIAQIAFYGGQSHLVEDPTQIYAESERLARESGGHFMDQFTYAERATDWRANNNIAESIFQQMRHEPYPTPTWLISSPGTGGTLATLGRYVRYRQHCTRVLCADAERSVFFDAYVSGDRGLTLDCGSRIEGIGQAAGRGVLPAGSDRRDGQGTGRLVAGGHALPGPAPGAAGRRFQRNQPDRRPGGRTANGRGRREGVAGGDSLRWRRTLCDHLLRSGLAGQAGLCAGTPGRGAGCLRRARRGVARRAAGGWTLKEWICTVCELPKPAISRP